MRGTAPRWLQRALGAGVWLCALCTPLACTGPGLEPPGDRSEAGGGSDAGGVGGSGGSATGGSGGPPAHSGDGDGDGDGDTGQADAGEVPMDAGVDEDGGSDPEELQP